jgi:hypothetical protein
MGQLQFLKKMLRAGRRAARVKRNPGLQRMGWMPGLALGALLAACASQPTAQSPESISTAAAQTVVAQITLDAGKTAVAELTRVFATLKAPPTSLPPTFTPPPFTPSPVILLTPTLAPVASPTQTACDAAMFVGDVSVPDGTAFAAGARFVKTWRLRNSGSCTWTRDYALVFTGGDPMGGNSALPLAGDVAPGESVDVSVTLTAPLNPGAYQGSWMLRNPAGVLFGVNLGASDPFWVRIRVQSIASLNDYSYDFSANFCMAQWTSGRGPLACPGSRGDANGYAILLNQPNLETGPTSDAALITVPNQDRGGWISGIFPSYRVQNQDHFRADVGCLSGSQGCNVIFEVDYQAANGRVVELGTWGEVYDGISTSIDLDLSDLSGRTVQFILSVNNQGRTNSANAYWLAPRIESGTLQPTRVLHWVQTGGVDNSCAELNLYLLNSQTAVAQAVSCTSQTNLGQVQLSTNDFNQLQAWVTDFKPADGEVYRATTTRPLISTVTFTGLGVVDASASDITLINNMAERLYNQITTGG